MSKETTAVTFEQAMAVLERHLLHRGINSEAASGSYDKAALLIAAFLRKQTLSLRADERVRVIEECARVMDVCATQYRKKSERLNPLAEAMVTEWDAQQRCAEACEWGGAVLRARLGKPPDQRC